MKTWVIFNESTKKCVAVLAETDELAVSSFCQAAMLNPPRLPLPGSGRRRWQVYTRGKRLAFTLTVTRVD